MGSSVSFETQKKAAQHLAFSRDQLRCDLMLRGFDRLVPQPESKLDADGIDEDDDFDSDSNSTDSEPDSSDHMNDVIMDDAGDAQIGIYNIPMAIASRLSFEEQNAVQNFEFVHSIPENMNISEGAQDQREGEEFMEDVAHTQSEERSSETCAYPDPEASEMVPPRTPILSHAELPLRSIEFDSPKNDTNETQDDAVQDLEADLSDITHLLRMYAELPLSPVESDSPNTTSNLTTDAEMQDSEDIPDISFPPQSADADATNTTTDQTEDGELPNTSTHLLHGKLWWQDFDNRLQVKQYITPPPVNDLFILPYPNSHAQHGGRSSDSIQCPLPPGTTEEVECHGTIPALSESQHLAASGTSSADKNQMPSLPEQPSAQESTPPATPTVSGEQDKGDDAVLNMIMEETKTMEAEAEATRAKIEQRRTRCRAHNASDPEHYNRLGYCRGIRRYAALALSRGDSRLHTRERVQAIRAERFSMPPWKKHCVWQRSLLVKETMVTPLLDHRGEQKTWYICHEGKGMTGGDLHTSRFKYCALCEGNCKGR
jgi:hypothetical protein